MRRTLVTLATTVAAAVAMGLSAAPAQAASGYDRCPAKHMCLFEHANGGGKYVSLRCGAPDLNEIGSGLDDMASSAWNRTSRSWYAFADYNYREGAGKVKFEPGGPGNLRRIYNDKISSIRDAYGC